MSTTSPFAKPTAAVIDRAARWTAGCARLAASGWTGLGWRAAQWRARLTWRLAETRRGLRARTRRGSNRMLQLTREVRAQLVASAGWAITLSSATAAAIAYAVTTSWATALHAAALAFIAASLLAIRAAQRYQAAVLRRQAAVLQGELNELRRMLHVTEAVLDVEELEYADELDEVTVARMPEQRHARPGATSLAARIRRLGQRLRR